MSRSVPWSSHVTIPDFAVVAFMRNLREFRTIFWALTLLGWVSAGLRFGTVVLLGNLVSRLTTLSVDEVVWGYLPLWAGCLFSAEVLDYFSRRYGETLAQKVSDITQERLTLAAMAAPLARLRSLSRERLLASIRSYCGHVERFGHEWCWTIVRRSFSMVAVVVVLFMQNPVVLAINLICVVLFLSVAFRISSRIAPYAARQMAQTLAVNERQTAFVLGLPFLKRFHGEHYYESSMQAGYNRSWFALDDLKRFHAWRWLLQLSLFDVMTLGTLGYGAYQVAAKELEVGFLVLLKWSFDELFQILVYLIESYVRLIHEREDAKLLREQFTALGIGEASILQPERSALGRINNWNECELKDVVISYGGEKEIRIPQFKLGRGEIVGLVGESGSGKTSFAEVLGRFSPFRGSFRIDGRSYRSGEAAPLSVLMITPHDPFFKATVRENLTLGREIPEARIMEVLQDVAADSFVDSLDAMIGEGTIAFSSGQEQRLRLARALLNDADILLLDEPLTGIDDETRGRIVVALERRLVGRTVIIVTHRPDELAFAQRIVRIEEGVLTV